MYEVKPKSNAAIYVDAENNKVQIQGFDIDCHGAAKPSQKQAASLILDYVREMLEQSEDVSGMKYGEG